MSEFAALTGEIMNSTVFVTPLKPDGVAILRVLISATVDAMVPDATPLASVVDPG